MSRNGVISVIGTAVIVTSRKGRVSRNDAGIANIFRGRKSRPARGV